MDRPVFLCDLQRRADDAVIFARGELDLNSGDLLRDAVQRALESAPTRVVLHLAHLTFCDSTGLSVLVGLMEQVRQSGSHLVIDRPHPIFARLLAVTGLDAVLDIQAVEDGIEPAVG